MGYDSKNIGAVVKSFYCREVDQTLLKVHAKNLVKVTRTGELMRRKRPPTLKKLSFKFLHQNSVIEARCFNYANN